MSGRLLSDASLRGLQKLASKGQNVAVEVFRRIEDDETDPYGSAVGYGDGVGPDPIATCKGWLHSTPTPMQQVDNGMLVTFNTYRLDVPVGTDILPGDRVRLNRGSEYNVSDTTNDESWPVQLVCSLRLKE